MKNESSASGKPAVDKAQKSAARTLEFLFLCFLFLSQIYYGYRYIFKYDSTGTSPTYANTPFAFKAAKYAIAIIFLFFSFMVLAYHRGRARVIKQQDLFFLVWVSGFVSYCAALGITFLQGPHALDRDLVFRGFFFFPLLAILPFHFRSWKSLEKYFSLILKFGCAYNVIYSVIQIAAYKLYGRLPALGYPHGLVRFGGGWDDPNAFAAFLVLPILFLVSDAFSAGMRRFVEIVVFLTLLALTVSLSGIGALLLAIGIYAVIRRKWSWIFVCALVVAGILIDPITRELLLFAYKAKQASIESHLTTMSLSTFVTRSSLPALLFGEHAGHAATNESYYVALTQNYGFVGLLWFLSIIVLTIVNSCAKASRYQFQRLYREAEVFRVLAAFIGGLSLASIGIAYFYVFPVNLYLWLSIFIVWLTPECVVTQELPREIRDEISLQDETSFDSLYVE